MACIDLHLHSTYSDGSCSPRQVVTRAYQSRVTVLSLTDHDTTDGIKEAFETATQFDIEIIPGIEVSTVYQGTETHILGYFIDLDNHQLQDELKQLRLSRESRIPQIIEKLNGLGLSLSHNEVRSVAGHGSIGRPHVAQVLLDKHYVSSIEEAFSRYLKAGAKADVPRQLPETKEAIRWIRQAGGVASLAHPGWVRNTTRDLESVCKDLQNFGLQGIEVFYSSHSDRQTTAYHKLAQRLGLHVTGGSDFHGKTKPDIEVGIGKGNLNISADVLEALRTCAYTNQQAIEHARA